MSLVTIHIGVAEANKECTCSNFINGLEGQSTLIVAPTATGKSFIGCEVVRSALEKAKPGPHAYLVPVKSLANEIYDGFHDLLGSTNFRLRISTGDYREPIRPEESDLIVATYESFAALVRRTGLAPGTVIADEIHLVADDHRGPVVEGLFSRLLASGRIASLCGLSAVVENGKELAEWLGIEFLEGTTSSRVVSPCSTTREDVANVLRGTIAKTSIALQPLLKLIQEVLHFGAGVFKAAPRPRHVRHEPLSLHGISK